MTNLDFIPNLNNELNTLNLFTKSEIGLLGIGESISVLALPGAQGQTFYDGTHDRVYSIQINAKSKKQANCLDTLNKIFVTLEDLTELPSSNDSYIFNGIDITSLPSYVGADDSGFHVWQISLESQITINGGIE